MSDTAFWTPERFDFVKDQSLGLAPASIDELKEKLKRLDDGSNVLENYPLRLGAAGILIALIEKKIPPYFAGCSFLCEQDQRFFDVLWLKPDRFDLAVKYCNDKRKAGQILNLLHADEFRSLGCSELIRSSLKSLRYRAMKQIEIDAGDILKSSVLKMSDERKRKIAVDAARRVCASRLAFAFGEKRRWARGAALHFWMFGTAVDASNLRRSLTEFRGRIVSFSVSETRSNSVSEIDAFGNVELGQ